MPSSSATHQLLPGRWHGDPARTAVGFRVEGGRAAAHGRFEGARVELVVGDELELRGTARPGMAFTSTAVRHDAGHLELDGRLTANGRTLAVVALGTLERLAPGAARIRLETRVDRRQFGLGGRGGASGHEVLVHADLHLIHQEPSCTR